MALRKPILAVSLLGLLGLAGVAAAAPSEPAATDAQTVVPALEAPVDWLLPAGDSAFLPAAGEAPQGAVFLSACTIACFQVNQGCVARCHFDQACVQNCNAGFQCCFAACDPTKPQCP